MESREREKKKGLRQNCRNETGSQLVRHTCVYGIEFRSGAFGRGEKNQSPGPRCEEEQERERERSVTLGERDRDGVTQLYWLAAEIAMSCGQ